MGRRGRREASGGGVRASGGGFLGGGVRRWRRRLVARAAGFGVGNEVAGRGTYRFGGASDLEKGSTPGGGGVVPDSCGSPARPRFWRGGAAGGPAGPSAQFGPRVIFLNYAELK